MAGMVVYSALRALVVAETLTEYGVHPWLFFALDVGSAFPLSWGQVRLVQGLRQQNPRLVQRAIIVVGCAFMAPYLYLVFGAGRPLPTLAYVIIAALVVFMFGSTFWRMRSEARASALIAVVNEEHEPR
jgi:hypothetical protein